MSSYIDPEAGLSEVVQVVRDYLVGRQGEKFSYNDLEGDYKTFDEMLKRSLQNVFLAATTS